MAPRRTKRVGFQPSHVPQDPKPRSLWKLIKTGVKHLGENGRKKKGGKNSKYTGRQLNLKDVKEWEDFITVEDVESLWRECEEIRDAFYEVLAPEDQGRCTWESPVSGGMLNEMCLERKWDSILDQLNLALEMCAKAEQKTSSPLYIKIADGANATHISTNAEEHAQRKNRITQGFCTATTPNTWTPTQFTTVSLATLKSSKKSVEKCSLPTEQDINTAERISKLRKFSVKFTDIWTNTTPDMVILSTMRSWCFSVVERRDGANWILAPQFAMMWMQTLEREF